jgi:2-polyprenyl-3-methyl-5-hydroxy-6-metoxy-1,4-benzoquinol methylase
MPTSNLAVAPNVLHFIWEVRKKPFRVLDVGPGHGKYSVLIREYVEPDVHITAIEAWEPYINQFGLECLYDRVVVGDVRHQPVDFFDDFDVVLMADVIEHIPKPDAWDVIDRIPGWIVVSTPRDFFHNGYGHPKTEDHVSHWSVDDFRDSKRFDIYDQPILNGLGCVLVRLKPTS